MGNICNKEREEAHEIITSEAVRFDGPIKAARLDTIMTD